MKRFVLGLIVGLFLFASTTVLADGIGLVGKKVTGTFTVLKDGKVIADAAIINGSTYAPIRSWAEATDTEFTVVGKKIILSGGVSTDTQKKEISFKIEAINKKISEVQSGINLYETDIIPKAESEYKSSIGTDEEQWKKSSLDSRNEEINAKKQQLAEYKSELTDLESQLAELQK